VRVRLAGHLLSLTLKLFSPPLLASSFFVPRVVSVAVMIRLQCLQGKIPCPFVLAGFPLGGGLDHGDP